MFLEKESKENFEEVENLYISNNRGKYWDSYR